MLMGVPTDQLVRTVDTWNGYCNGGEDLAFFRPGDTLTPIRTAPFYAQLCAPAMLNTDGGPVRNAEGAVVDVDGNPIPGLYSAGEFGSRCGATSTKAAATLPSAWRSAVSPHAPACRRSPESSPR